MARFVEITKEWGVDNESVPARMLIAHTGFNLVLLRDGKGLTLQPDRKGRIGVHEITKGFSISKVKKLLTNFNRPRNLTPETNATWDDLLTKAVDLANGDSARPIIVTGNVRGDVILKAVRQKREDASINIAVVSTRTIKVAFNYVGYVISQRSRHEHTTRKEGGAVELLKQLNRVFAPQANIVFKMSRPAQWVWVEGDLNKIVTLADLPKFKDKGDPAANWNVFFVGEAETKIVAGRKGPADHDAAFTVPGISVVEDVGGKDTVVHEAGHFAGSTKDLVFGGHDASEGHPNWLTFSPWTLRTGSKLHWRYAIEFNARAK